MSGDNATLPAVGTVVLAGNGLGIVVRHARRGGVIGVDVQSTEHNNGLYTAFQQDWTIRPAVVGITVCDRPWGEHNCGLHHASPEDLATLPGSDAPAAKAVA